MKYFYLIIVFLVIKNYSFAQTDTDGFRGFKWGTSKKIVLNINKSLKPLSHNRYIELDSAFGFMAKIGFDFTDGKLKSGIYFFQNYYTDYNLYFENYNKLKKLLISQYGKPSKDTLIFRFNEYKQLSESEIAREIFCGEIECNTFWENKSTDILLAISNDIESDKIYFTLSLNKKTKHS